MQNIIKTREMLAQIRFGCLEIAHGCENLQTAAIALEDLLILAAALGETHANSVKIAVEWESSGIDESKDHDGDTQPANDPPAVPVCKCGHTSREHMPRSFVEHGVLVDAGGCCIFCSCEKFEQ